MSQNVINIMRIERNPLTNPAADVEKPGKPTAPAPISAATSFEETHRLNQSLAATPEVRADQVARAKALIADSNYPSEKQLDKIANLLARNWQQES